MEICLSIIILFLNIAILYNQWEIKKNLGSGTGQVPDSVIQDLDKVIKRVGGFIK